MKEKIFVSIFMLSMPVFIYFLNDYFNTHNIDTNSTTTTTNYIQINNTSKESKQINNISEDDTNSGKHINTLSWTIELIPPSINSKKVIYKTWGLTFIFSYDDFIKIFNNTKLEEYADKQYEMWNVMYVSQMEDEIKNWIDIKLMEDIINKGSFWLYDNKTKKDIKSIELEQYKKVECTTEEVGRRYVTLDWNIILQVKEWEGFIDTFKSCK